MVGSWRPEPRCALAVCIGTQLVLSEVLGGHKLGDSFLHLMCDFTVEGVHA